jgi:F-type H+-transporting ATPase subunit b
MIDLDATFFVQLINFIVSLIFLNVLLIKPIRGILKKRAESIASSLTETDSFTSAAESKIKNYEAALAEARKAGAQQRLTLKDEGSKEEKQLVEAAVKQAQESLTAARGEIAKQVQAAMDSLKGQADALAQKAVGKVLG